MNYLKFKRLIYRILQIGLVGLLSFIVYYLMQMSLTGNMRHGYEVQLIDMFSSFDTIKIVLINVAILAMLYFLVIAILGNYWIGLSINTIVMSIYIFANYNKVVSRNEPLLPSDLIMAKQVGGLSKMVNPTAILLMILFVVLILALGIYLSKKSKNLRTTHFYSLLCRFIFIAYGAMFFSMLMQAGNTHSIAAKTLAEMNVTNTEKLQTATYSNSGTLVGFAFNASTTPMEKPTGYSKTAVKKIVDRYQPDNSEATTPDKKVNIIYILNESLTNPGRTVDKYPIKNNQNPMPYISNILDNPGEDEASGYMVSPGFGGGTADIEFEANTGFSNYFLNNTPYQDILPQKNTFPSVMNYLSRYGYNSDAYHPYSGQMYRRNEAYPALGISKFDSESKLKGLKKASFSNYYSDASAYPNFYKQQNKNKQFSLMITMQNHMPYIQEDGSKSDYKLVNKIDNDDGKTDKLQTYFQEVKESDDAYKQLVDHYKNSNQKTIIVMYGDHYPGDGVYDDLYNKDTLNSHATPFVMSANFPLQTHHYDYFSPNYMSLQLLDQLGYPRTSFYQLLADLQQEVPVLTKPLQMNSRGEQHKIKIPVDNANDDSSDESDNDHMEWSHSQVYKDYRIIEYDMTYGKGYAQKDHMFDNN